MNFLETFLVGVALAMDAFAVSIALGTADGKNFNWKKIILTALFFGGFQFFMPAAGWFCGSLFSSFLQRYGRIIAFILLAFLGGKMIYERNREERAEFGLVQLTVLALATSIDALLVGVGYACLGRSGILLDAALIGTVTFFIA